MHGTSENAGYSNEKCSWPEGLQAILESLPPATEIPPREEGFPAEWYFDARRSVKNAAERMSGLDAQRREREHTLRADRERYDDIRGRGPAALSRYDVEIANGGDAAAACIQAIELKIAHVSLDLSVLAAIDKELVELAAVIERDRAQLPLF